MLSQHPITLYKSISALAIESDARGGDRYGPIEQLPTGARVVFIGDRFNDRTVEVQCTVGIILFFARY